MTPKTEQRSGLSPAEYARLKNCTLDYVYKLLVAGRLAGRKQDGKWIIEQFPTTTPTAEQAG
jgi:hypothetical protein